MQEWGPQDTVQKRDGDLGRGQYLKPRSGRDSRAGDCFAELPGDWMGQDMMALRVPGLLHVVQNREFISEALVPQLKSVGCFLTGCHSVLFLHLVFP